MDPQPAERCTAKQGWFGTLDVSNGITLIACIAAIWFGALSYLADIRIRDLEDRNNALSASQIFSREAGKLKGWGLNGEDQRIEANDPAYRSAVKYQLDFAAINSLQATVEGTETLTVSIDADGEDFRSQFVAPILIAKCQSTDPGIAGSAMVATANLLQDKHREWLRDPANRLGRFRTAFSTSIFSKVQFTGPERINFTHLPFAAANFSGATFHNVNFDGATLHGSVFKDATFKAVSFANVNPKMAEPSEASSDAAGTAEDIGNATSEVMKPTVFTDAVFDTCSGFVGSDFTECNFDGAALTDVQIGKLPVKKGDSCQAANSSIECSANFSGTFWRLSKKAPASLTRCSFNFCNLRGAFFTGGNLSGVEFSGSDLFSADFANATVKNAEAIETASLRNTRFSDCCLCKAKFDGATLNDVSFVKGKAHAISFRGVTPTNVSFTDIDLWGANFLDTNLAGVSFNNARMKWCRLPTGLINGRDPKTENSVTELPLLLFANGEPDIGKHPILLLAVNETKEGGRKYRLDGILHATQNGTRLVTIPPTAAALLDRVSKLSKEEMMLLDLPKLDGAKIDQALKKKEDDPNADKEIEEIKNYISTQWEMDF
jgi:uncharacterized protein YjbI with pentapeptide repeats